jgi:hypothetical protein
MGFAESLCTLSMDKMERDRYYELANSSDPQDRAKARAKITGCYVTPADLVATYKKARTNVALDYSKEQYSDMKDMIKDITRKDPQYENVPLAIQARFQDVYKPKTEQSQSNGPDFDF